MSIIHFDTTSATGERVMVNLGGDNVQDWDVVYAEGGWIFNSNGTVSRNDGGAGGSVNPLTDWIYPRDSFTASDWQVRGTYDSIAFERASTQPDNVINEPVGTEGAWNTLNVSQSYIWVCSTTTFGLIKFIDANIRFEIRNLNDPSWNTLTSVFGDSAAIAAFGIYHIDLEAFTLN